MYNGWVGRLGGWALLIKRDVLPLCVYGMLKDESKGKRKKIKNPRGGNGGA